MLRNNVVKSSRRLLATVSDVSPAATKPKDSQKIWNDNIASESFKAGNTYRNALLDGVPANGPPSLKDKFYKKRYYSPIGLNEAFDVAYDLLKSKSQAKYDEIAKLDEELSKSPESQELKDRKVKLQTEAEIDNPEVKFNFDYNEKLENNTRYIDYEQPVYRELKKKHWENYSQMLLMQRLESLAVIPDTLPTLEPKAEVSLKFLNHSTVNRWIEPGTLLSSNVTTYPPSIKIQEFENVDTKNQLYTVLIVNPDVPDIERNTYKTHIQWGLSNIKLGFNNNFISPSRLLEDESIHEIIDYLPPVPEKNLPQQRFSVWVFRQPKEISDKITEREFDIRKYVETHDLLPIGAHFWRSSWDLNVSKVREKYGLPKGIVFHKVRGKDVMS